MIRSLVAVLLVPACVVVVLVAWPILWWLTDRTSPWIPDLDEN